VACAAGTEFGGQGRRAARAAPRGRGAAPPAGAPWGGAGHPRGRPDRAGASASGSGRDRAGGGRGWSARSARTSSASGMPAPRGSAGHTASARRRRHGRRPRRGRRPGRAVPPPRRSAARCAGGVRWPARSDRSQGQALPCPSGARPALSALGLRAGDAGFGGPGQAPADPPPRRNRPSTSAAASGAWWGSKPRRSACSCPSGNRAATPCAKRTASADLPTPAGPVMTKVVASVLAGPCGTGVEQRASSASRPTK
jgi:hypothetical protein